MTPTERQQFLERIMHYAEKHPEDIQHIVAASNQGALNRIKDLSERAAQMEAALAISLQRRLKGQSGFIAGILERWSSESSLNWSQTIQELKARK